MNGDLFTGSLVRLDVLDTETDVKTLLRWCHNSEYMRLLDSIPAQFWNEKNEKEWIEKNCAEEYSFAIRTLADERMIGIVELSGLDLVSGNIWLGIGIGESADWGKGYGADAMRVASRFAFTELNVRRISLNVFEYNQRALSCYQKLGFQVEGREREAINREGKRWDLIYMGLLRSEWLAGLGNVDE